MFFLNNSLFANEINCKKFDLKCKAKKFIEETKDYQNKGLQQSKKQINKTKDCLYNKECCTYILFLQIIGQKHLNSTE